MSVMACPAALSSEIFFAMTAGGNTVAVAIR